MKPPIFLILLPLGFFSPAHVTPPAQSFAPMRHRRAPTTDSAYRQPIAGNGIHATKSLLSALCALWPNSICTTRLAALAEGLAMHWRSSPMAENGC